MKRNIFSHPKIKKFNFTKVQHEEQGPAISRTTSVAPNDFVGELRVTKFKLTKESFPSNYISPSKHKFNREEMESIPPNMIPTDYCIILLADTQMADAEPIREISNSVHNGEKYLLNTYINDKPSFGNAKVDCKILYPFINHRDESSFPEGGDYLAIYIKRYCIPGTCNWERQDDNNYILKNEDYIIYSINDINNLPSISVFAHQSSAPIYSENAYINIFKNISSTVTFDFAINCKSRLEPTFGSTYTTPTILLSKEYGDLLGINDVIYKGSIPTHSVYIQAAINNNYDFIVPSLEFKWGPYVSGLLSQIPFEYKYNNINFSIDGSAIATVNTISSPKAVFPLSHILLTCDELNFEGEEINVNTTQQQGVINPSSLRILKSFFIGITDDTTSDFIYVEDNLDNMPVIVNSPRLCSLTFRLWIMTNNGTITPLILKQGNLFSLQLTLI